MTEVTTIQAFYRGYSTRSRLHKSVLKFKKVAVEVEKEIKFDCPQYNIVLDYNGSFLTLIDRFDSIPIFTANSLQLKNQVSKASIERELQLAEFQSELLLLESEAQWLENSIHERIRVCVHCHFYILILMLSLLINRCWKVQLEPNTHLHANHITREK